MTRAAFLDPSSQADLDRYGFTRVNFLDAELLGAVRSISSELGPAPDDPRGSIHFGFFSHDREWKRRVKEELRNAVEEPIAQLFDRQIVYFAMFVTKWPGELGAFGPHQDPSYVDERRHRTVTVWCPLEATGVVGEPDCGALHLVPGSHRLGPDLRVSDTSLFAHRAAEDVIIDRLGVAVPTRPGQAVVFDNRTVHYSYPNRSGRPRVVLAVGLRPVESTCVHVEVSRLDPTRVEVTPVSDEYFTELDPLTLQIEGPGGAASSTEALPDPVPAAMTIRAAEAAGVPSCAVPSFRPDDDGLDVRYCFLCAGTERLLVRPDRERGGMTVCEVCLTQVIGPAPADAEREEPADPGPVLEPSAPSPQGRVRRTLRRLLRPASSVG